MATTVIAATALALGNTVLNRRRVPEHAVQLKRFEQRRINWKTFYTDPSDDIGNPIYNDRGKFLNYGNTSTGFFGVPRVYMTNPVGYGHSTRIYAWPNKKSTYTAYQ